MAEEEGNNNILCHSCREIVATLYCHDCSAKFCPTCGDFHLIGDNNNHKMFQIITTSTSTNPPPPPSVPPPSSSSSSVSISDLHSFFDVEEGNNNILCHSCGEIVATLNCIDCSAKFCPTCGDFHLIGDNNNHKMFQIITSTSTNPPPPASSSSLSLSEIAGSLLIDVEEEEPGPINEISSLPILLPATVRSQIISSSSSSGGGGGDDDTNMKMKQILDPTAAESSSTTTQIRDVKMVNPTCDPSIDLLRSSKPLSPIRIKFEGMIVDVARDAAVASGLAAAAKYSNPNPNPNPNPSPPNIKYERRISSAAVAAAAAAAESSSTTQVRDEIPIPYGGIEKSPSQSRTIRMQILKEKKGKPPSPRISHYEGRRVIAASKPRERGRFVKRNLNIMDKTTTTQDHEADDKTTTQDHEADDKTTTTTKEDDKTE